jgi:hypothetical protein
MARMTFAEDIHIRTEIQIEQQAIIAPPAKLRKTNLEDDVSTTASSQRVDELDSPKAPLDMKEELTSEPLVKAVASVAPSTPRQNSSRFPTTPPAAPRDESMPMLMRALKANSTTLVQNAIEAEPDVARFPFWDHEVEPPLCFAVRQNCSADIIDMLLLHGAELDAKDLQGRSPADILTSMRMVRNASTDFGAIENLLGVPAAELRNITTTTWQDSVDMCGLTDWRVFDCDISTSGFSATLKDHDIEALMTAFMPNASSPLY